MPWQKFEALYAAHTKREAVQSITNVRNAQISGIWANTNLDPQSEGQNPRANLLKDIYDNYVESLQKIYNQYEEKKDEIDWDDPFYKAMKVPSNPHANDTSPEPHDQNLPVEIDQFEAGDLA